MYYLFIMGLFDKFSNPFNFIKKQEPKNPLEPTRIKSDGTKVIEQDGLFGKNVYEIKKNGLVLCMTYNKDDKLIMDWARRVNLEIGHVYDEYGKMIYEFNSYYDEKDFSKLVRKTETQYGYDDSGVKNLATTIVTPGDIKTEIKYDKEGKQAEKIEYRGSVKTYFDSNNKPFKREIDRGSGGIITENL